MQVIIKEKEYEYVSDFPQGWQYSSGDYFKFPVLIGNHKCFIKRFEKKTPNVIPGWELLNRLKYKFEPDLPRVFDIVSTEEKRKPVHYVFYEYLKGVTLNARVESGTSIDLQRLTNDLYGGMSSIHKYEYWFVDFCEKNIFCEDSGRFVLLDLDSAHPVSEPPDNKMDGNKDYWALVYNFYKDIINYKQLKVTDIAGVSLNHLQIIFLILHLKISLQDQHLEYMSPFVHNNLPACLDNIDPAFRELFLKVYEAGKRPEISYSVDEIKDLISRNIIHSTITFPPPDKRPVILKFESSGYVVQRGETFSLDWEVENADYVELYKDGNPFKRLDATNRSIVISEAYDGKDRELVYTLVAANSTDQTTSVPITVKITDRIKEEVAVVPPVIPLPPENKPSKTEPPRYKPPSAANLRTIRLALYGLAIVAIAAAWLIVYPFRKKAEAFKFEPKKITEEHTIVITGKNFPKDSNDVQVLFNKVRSRIQFNSDNFIRVTVPVLGERIGDGMVQVAVVVKKDTIFVPGTLFVERIAAPAPSTPVPIVPQKTADSPVVKIQKLPKRPKVVAPQEVSPDSSDATAKDEAEKTNEEANKPFPIYDFVSATPNKYTKYPLGGITNLKITVENTSKYDLDNVVVEVTYVRNNGKEFKKETISFPSVKAHTSITKDAPESNSGTKVRTRVTSIISQQLN